MAERNYFIGGYTWGSGKKQKLNTTDNEQGTSN
jgi:hypothetical protein